MGTERFKGALLAALIIASLITPLLLLSPSPVHAALTPHAPIYIDGNAGFTPENGVNGGGSGTENDPYIIENYSINAENANGIEIRNTTAYFVIRNCYMYEGWVNYNLGIYLDNVKNGKIDNSNVENNHYGIILSSSDNNLISNNIVENNHYGIILSSSDNNLISNNIVKNSLDGIYLGGSDNNLVENNLVENSRLSGIYLSYSDNNFLSNNLAKNSRYEGIYIYSSDNNLVLNSLVENNYYGIYIDRSSNNYLRNNILSNNTYNLNVFGSQISHFYQDIDTSNKIGGKPIYYMIEQENLILDGNVMDIGYLGLVSCENIQVKNLNMSNNGNGIVLLGSSNNRIENITASNNIKFGISLINYSNNNLISNNLVENNRYGIVLKSSSNNLISNNLVGNTGEYGISLGNSHNNLISNNLVKNNVNGVDFTLSNNNLVKNNILENHYFGIYLNSSDNNLFSNNLVENNRYYGIYLGGSDNNLLSNNLVENSHSYGILLLGSYNNRIYHNNFVNNATQASDYEANYWDDGYPSGGNYWSDYAGEDKNKGENQDIPGSDGIGDAAYDIPGRNNQDRYPLMCAFGLVTLYKINLNANLYFGMGSKLVLKFYTYAGAFQAENVVWSGTTPNHVALQEDITHSQGKSVEKVRLVQTYDNTEEVISTLATFVVRRVSLEARLMEIPLEWALAPSAGRVALEIEFAQIPLYWALAPS